MGCWLFRPGSATLATLAATPTQDRRHRTRWRDGWWKTGHRPGSAGVEGEDSAISDDAGQRFALTLHIGTGKTGTTSLQSFLRHTRSRLADAGWLYPRSVGPARHVPFGVWIRPDDELTTAFHAGRPGTRGFATVQELRREVPRRLLAEVGRTGLHRVLMSDEGLWQSSEPSLERLRQFADAHASGVRLVCYLRRQDDHVVSRYQQVVKHGETRTLPQRVAEIDLTTTYDYYARLQMWLRVVGPDEIVLRRFERHRMLNDSLYDDFVDAAGLGIATDDLPPRRNESLDAESVELLRLLNLHRRALDGESAGIPPPNRIIRRLQRASTGPVLTLSEDRLDRFMARWEESNRAVAREYFPEGPDTLFESARRTRDTTTDQRLDPSRLDHFLELLEIPPELHEPLRRIAEREAARPA